MYFYAKGWLHHSADEFSIRIGQKVLGSFSTTAALTKVQLHLKVYEKFPFSSVETLLDTKTAV